MLTEKDYLKAATALGTDIAVIKAVKQVETGKYGAFFATGKPSILFEGHVFRKELIKRAINPNDYLPENENILHYHWNRKYYLGGIREYTRLEQAAAIHKEAAYCSASWGMFQIMGFNYKLCNCKDIFEFVELMSSGENSQLDLFVGFLVNTKLNGYLRELNWREFARRYNGPGYKENGYDYKLYRAYNELNLQKPKTDFKEKI